MRTTVNRLSNSFVAYLCLLCGFVSLGLFVYALAAASVLAAALGAAVVVCFGTSAMVFRSGARNVAVRDESGNTIDSANVWAQPLRRAQVETYLATYRGSRSSPATPGDRIEPVSLPSRRGRHVSRNTNVSQTRHRGSRHLPQRQSSLLPR